MKSGVSAIWRTSDALDQIAGTRTLPSPRMTLSSMPPTNVMHGAAEEDAREDGRAVEHRRRVPPIQPKSRAPDADA